MLDWFAAPEKQAFHGVLSETYYVDAWQAILSRVALENPAVKSKLVVVIYASARDFEWAKTHVRCACCFVGR